MAPIKHEDAPRLSDFDDPKEYRKAYSRWYYRNVQKKNTDKMQGRRNSNTRSYKRKQAKDLVLPEMSKGYKSGAKESAKARTGWQKNTVKKEAEITSRIEIIELPEGVSAEEYENEIFSV